MMILHVLLSVFTGLGLGILFFLGLNLPEVLDREALVFYVPALVLTSIGLIAGIIQKRYPPKPSKTLEASSARIRYWISRDNTYLFLATFSGFVVAATKAYLGYHPVILGYLNSSLSLIAVLTMSLTYTRWPNVPRWNTPVLVILFPLAAVAGGGLLTAQLIPAVLLLAGLIFVQLTAWLWEDAKARRKAAIQHLYAASFGTPKVWERWALRGVGLMLTCILPLLGLWFVEIHPIQISAVIISHLLGMILIRTLFLEDAAYSKR
ncbi:MAG: hypothetical protein AAF198_06685 [Pseudomonadota bacterium]